VPGVVSRETPSLRALPLFALVTAAGLTAFRAATAVFLEREPGPMLNADDEQISVVSERSLSGPSCHRSTRAHVKRLGRAAFLAAATVGVAPVTMVRHGQALSLNERAMVPPMPTSSQEGQAMGKLDTNPA
jgi:hypothetical protein